MALNTFHDLKSLVAHAEQRIDDFDVISLDIFETLFIRRIPHPDMVKHPVARFIAGQAELAGLPVPARKVNEARYRIENEHRARNGREYPDHEARYDDFMRELLDEIFGDRLPPGLFEQVAEFEMRLESAVIVVRETLFEWIRTLHARGKRVFLISDIYLPAKYLKRICDDKGVSPFIEDVISSADSFNAKASGTAFPLIADRYGLDPERWLHIGDNPVSDHHRPGEHGITALHIHDIGEHHRLSLATRYNFYASQRDFWKGRNIYQWMLPLEAENHDREPLFNDGFGFLGYMLSYFIHRLIERCKDKEITRVYFCSREGWMFKRIWDELAPWFYPAGDAPQVSYLYVSRMALASPACAYKGLTAKNARVARFPAGNRDFHDLCRIFKFDVAEFEPVLARHGLSADDPIGINAADYDKKADMAFNEAMLDPEFQDIVKRQTRANNEALQRYLEQEGFFEHEEVAIVDIGWLGTIQHYITDAVGHRSDMPRLNGFTLGAIRLMPYHDDWNSKLEGLVHDAYRPSFFTAMTDMIKPILEEVCRAPHPTLLGYELVKGEVELRFRTTEDAVGQAEIAQDAYYAPLHEGIMEAARRYGPAVLLSGYNTNQLKPWLNFMLLARVAFPRTAEVQRLRHHEHQDDFYGSNKPSKKAVKEDETLWTSSDRALRFNPFLRTRWFIKHTLKFLQR